MSLALKGAKCDESNHFFTNIKQINTALQLNDDDTNRLPDDLTPILLNEDPGTTFYQNFIDQSGTRLIDFTNVHRGTVHRATQLRCKKDDEFSPDILEVKDKLASAAERGRRLLIM